MDLKTKIRIERKRAKLSQEGLAIACGWETNSRISNYENGLRTPTIEDLKKIAAALGIPPSVLIEESNIEPGPDFKGRVPLISWVQAGIWSEISDNFSPGDAEEWLSCPVRHGPRTFVVRVRGESMYNPHGRPSFMDGDLIYVDPDKPANNGSLIIARLDDNKEATFKKLVIEGEKRFLRALNPLWPDPIIEISGDATICGVVFFKGEQL